MVVICKKPEAGFILTCLYMKCATHFSLPKSGILFLIAFQNNRVCEIISWDLWTENTFHVITTITLLGGDTYAISNDSPY